MMCVPTGTCEFEIHRIIIDLDGGGCLEDRVIIDATAPDGVRRSMTAGEWHYGVLTDAEGDHWGRLSSCLNRIAYALERSDLLPGVRRDVGYARGSR
jgi:hypothetical protein